MQRVSATLADAGATVVAPLVVAGHAAGILVLQRPRGEFSVSDLTALELLTDHVSMSLENQRLYRQLEGLFRQYMPEDVASALLADPEQAALGGESRVVTTLFADLRGFTSYAERGTPQQVVELLNNYFGAAVPAILTYGGTVTAFIGDAVMALFGAPTSQPDHARRAVRAGLALQRAVEELTAFQPWWPRFRVGVNTGEAVVGNIGTAQRSTYTAIGDAVNLASRLESVAEPGQVVVGPATYEAVQDVADVRPLGAIHVKGKQHAVEAYVVERFRDATINPNRTQAIEVPRRTPRTTP